MSKEISRVLIANRGEVVIRVTRALRALGIGSVAVFTDPDRGAPWTTCTDTAYALGDSKNYLNIEAIIAAAKATGADAVHPGYGFLAENSKFAQAVVDAGMTFIGPTASTIERLGSKTGAKAILSQSAPDVPLIPGYIHKGASESLSSAEWRTKADSIGYPVLIKAAAGGGGKGMRVVREPAEFESSMASVLVEAKGAFGDSTVFLERYFEDVRHIEVQILGDSHGSVVHLFERECSIQRRHQKLIEESPSPALDEATRSKICLAAVQVGRSIKYANAGTVEFIVNRRNPSEFHFLEVNTRLQVEHAVTEKITGIDIVVAQIFIAQGHRLEEALALSRRVFSRGTLAGMKELPPPGLDAPPLLPSQPKGWSIEIRLYAEDDAFAPCVGQVAAWRSPSSQSRDDSLTTVFSGGTSSDSVDVHTAVDAGSTITVYYDGLIAKLVSYSNVSRNVALDHLIRALRETVVFGVVTNRRALINLLRHEKVRSGEMSTDLIDKKVISATMLQQPLLGPNETVEGQRALAATIADAALSEMAKKSRRGVWGAIPSGFSNTRSPSSVSRTFVVGEDRFTVTKRGAFDGKLGQKAMSNECHAASVQFNAGTAQDVNLALLPDPRPLSINTSPQLVRFIQQYQLTALASSNVDVVAGPTQSVVVMVEAAPLDNDVGSAVVQNVHVQFPSSGAHYSMLFIDRHGGLTQATRSAAQDAASVLTANFDGKAADDGDGAAGLAKDAVKVRSPIPAKIFKVLKAEGESVSAGEVVMVIESMKMETKIPSPVDGKVRFVGSPKAGQLVGGGKVVFAVEKA